MWERYIQDPTANKTDSKKLSEKLAAVDDFFDRIGRIS